ncbi:YraN family protein [Kytococcus sedentarius]|uniref:YraN family protein n=1 Tax=Kytococcus sedentarius TaxID=1276 RepID=UPI0035BBF803
MTRERTTLGRRGEDIAARWWQERGARVLDRNWRHRLGEIDLVVALGPRLVVCEVKTRSTVAFGAPIEMVTLAQRRRLRRLTAAWLQEHPGSWAEIRIDVVGVLAPRRGPATVQHVPGALS